MNAAGFNRGCMEENRDNKPFLILGLIIFISCLLCAGIDISDAYKARRLEINCTQKTTGVVCDTGEIRPDPKTLLPIIEYVVVEYKVDDAVYTTKGKGIAKIGKEVTVWYDKENPEDSYAGNSPVKYSRNVVLLHLLVETFGMTLGALMIMEYRNRRKG